jgi:O-antigen/teichoic acid export membrane protein
VSGYRSSPLLRNGDALMANAVVTGVLGLAFWLLAARHYQAADVGRASAGYSALNLIAGITALSLMGAMARFIPRAGPKAGRLIRLGYAASVLSAIAGSAVFAVIAGRPGTSYSELSSFWGGLVFTGCVVVWALFTLQDGALIGLRSANWVTLENAAFGIAKIGLLLPLAGLLPHGGLYVAWMAPAALAVPLVNLLIFGRLLPGRASEAGAGPPGRAEVGRFLAGDVPGALMLLATISLVPVLVALFVPPSMNAYFYMAWAIGATIDLLATNMALTLTAAGALDRVQLAGYARAALRRIMIVLVPVATGAALLAPFVLGLFGTEYGRYGAQVLILLAAATLPKAVTEIYLGALRAANRTSFVALIQGVRAVLILGLTVGLVRFTGIAGAGIAVLISQSVVAAAILPGLAGVLRADKRQPADAARSECEPSSRRRQSAGPLMEALGDHGIGWDFASRAAGRRDSGAGGAG